MDKTLTISIAAYNMEAWIKRALDSLLDKRVIDDLEVFVVDDGGTDRTLEIVKEYALQYPNSIFPIHKENGGYGSTVNYSVKHANGKYLKLLDADDWFDADGLYKLVTALKTSQADVVVTNFCSGAEESAMKTRDILDLEPQILMNINRVHFHKALFHHELTYRTEVLRNSNLVLPEHMLYTDIIYTMVPFSQAKTIYYLDCMVYCYWVGRDGQSVSRQTEIRHIQDHIETCKIVCETYEKQKQTVNTNLDYMRYVAAYAANVLFRCTFSLFPLSRKTERKLKANDLMVHQISEDVYQAMTLQNRAGRILKLLRTTNYVLYYPLRLLHMILKAVLNGVNRWEKAI